MSNIEKDIKFIEEMIKEYKTFGDLYNPDYEDTDKIYKALENMLERIKELEEEKKNRVDFQQKYIEITNLYLNSIPKQKVKDFLDKINKEYNKLDVETDKQIKDRNKDYFECKEKIAVMQTLAYCRDNLEEMIKEDKL